MANLVSPIPAGQFGRFSTDTYGGNAENTALFSAPPGRLRLHDPGAVRTPGTVGPLYCQRSARARLASSAARNSSVVR